MSTLYRTALSVFEKAGVVRILGEDPLWIGNVGFYGTSYMTDTMPIPQPGSLNILVTHDMILEDKLYKEQEDFTHVSEFDRKNEGWSLVVCGHYHYRFLYEGQNCRILNPGAVVRIKASKGDMELVPAVFLFDSETEELTEFPLPHEPAEDVFVQGMFTAEKTEKSDQLFRKLLTDLQEKGGDSINLSDVALAFFAENEYDDDVVANVKNMIVASELMEKNL